MILSRGKTSSANAKPASMGSAVSTAKYNLLSIEDFLMKRDYTGARAYLEFIQEHKTNNETEPNPSIVNEWLAFCSFHLGDYQKALDQYDQHIIDVTDIDILNNNKLNKAICMFYLGLYEEAQELLTNINESSLKKRLSYHLIHKLNDEELLEKFQNSMTNSIEDQLSIASMHYLCGHYQEAIDIYKKNLLENKEYTALNVYLALCFYKLDYYDMSQEVLELYLKHYPISTVAINLKACNRFRLFNNRTAEQEIKSIASNTNAFGADLIKHNLVVFRNGDGALQVLPSLINIIPEARLNLAIYHLRNGNIQKAFDLIKDQKPNSPSEYILKGVVYAALGQQNDTREYIKIAKENFHLIGNSATECDTIPGRQSMASAFFLNHQFEEVLVYMNSIRSYFVDDDIFNYNYAQAKCATGYYNEAEELLMKINDFDIRNQHTYRMILAKCHIHSGRPELAWDIFIERDSSTETFLLLQLIANECYRCEQFWVAAKAFDMLEKLDPSPENWEGKRGACIGVLYACLSKTNKGQPQNHNINDIIILLRNSTNSQGELIIKTIRKHLTVFK